MSSNEQNLFCTIASVAKPLDGTRAALLNAARWEADVLNIRFLEGDPALCRRVLDVAREWTGPDMARLTLNADPDSEADIRIAFRPGRGSWSYLGTQAHEIPAGEPTMNFGWLAPDSDDDVLRRVVLHEFGHAIGLVHEHQNPSAPVQWNRDAVVADLSGPPNNWDLPTIEHNIFKNYAPEETTSEPTDPTSIMMYPIPAAWTTDGFSAGLNADLSENDRRFIREAYPW